MQVRKARGINVNAVACPDTFRSSINLSQGAPATVRSTYTELHASSMPQLMQAVQTVAQQRAQVSYLHTYTVIVHLYTVSIDCWCIQC